MPCRVKNKLILYLKFSMLFGNYPRQTRLNTSKYAYSSAIDSFGGFQ